jgi:hypothetical protein
MLELFIEPPHLLAHPKRLLSQKTSLLIGECPYEKGTWLALMAERITQCMEKERLSEGKRRDTR